MGRTTVAAFAALVVALLLPGVVVAQHSPALWFTQTVDHFNASDHRTFQQKWYLDMSQHKPNGPLFIYINGEGPIGGPPSNAVNEIYAAHFGAAVATLEHRYYGESSPFSDLSTPNLRYLSTEQALADLAEWIPHVNANHVNATKVITFGCSYSGALSAWFRLKYPHIADAAISSSGVVNAILDFTSFDEQVAVAAGPVCSERLRTFTSLVQSQLATNNAQVKAMFSAAGVPDDDFLYMVANVAAESVQYGFQAKVCGAVNVSDASLVEAFAHFANNFFFPTFGGTAQSYNKAVIKQQHAPNADRTWWYQKCTELAYFQNAPASGSLRSSWVNMTYHEVVCREAFDGAVPWPPTTERTNKYYGGSDIQATKVFFLNSSQDPWQRASVESSPNAEEPVFIVQCGNCGHCTDFRGCPSLPPKPPITGCNDMEHVEQARTMTHLFLTQWLAE